MYPGFMDCTQAMENQVAMNMPHEMEGSGCGELSG